jgi:hypothetical protein
MLTTILLILSYWKNYYLIAASIIAFLAKVIYDLGIFNGIKFDKGYLPEKQIYWREYLGDLREIIDEIENIKSIISKFNLDNNNNYNAYALYREELTKNNKLVSRALVGIMKNKQYVPEKNDEIKFKEYLLDHQFFQSSLPYTRAIFANFPLRSDFSWQIGTKKFYSSLKSKLTDDEFHTLFSSYQLKENSFPVIEVYKKDKMTFYVPLENYASFTIDSLNNIRDN